MPRQFTCNDAGVFTETTGDAVQQFSNVEVLSRFAAHQCGERGGERFLGCLHAITWDPGLRVRSVAIDSLSLACVEHCVQKKCGSETHHFAMTEFTSVQQYRPCVRFFNTPAT